jgi:hypothetical protein
MSLRERYALIALLILFLLLATVYNAVSTPFEAPDEIGHFYYIVYLLQNRRLPVVPAEEPSPNYEHEGVQPPFYYLSAALFVRALSAPLQLDLEDADAPLDINPHSVCGRPGAWHNVAYLAHDPHKERFPYEGRVRVLHAVRLWSSLLAAATVAGVFAAARLIFPERPVVAWLAAGVTAFTPEFLFTAGAASNDNMVTTLTTWGVYLTLRTLKEGLLWRRTLCLGLLAGLSALSKLSGALLLPLVLLVIPLAAMHRRHGPPHRTNLWRRLPQIIGHWSLVLSLFVAIAGWWFFRNWTLYGDPTGASQMLTLLPLRDEMSVGVLIRELGGLFRSWWGVFGCTLPPAGFYVFYLALVLGGSAGLIADRRHLRRAWVQMGVLLVWLILMFAAYVRWNWVIHAPKGRLLYPAMLSVACFLGHGWAYWTARWRWLTLALLVPLVLGAGIIPFAVMAPPVSPPPTYPTASDIHPEHPLDGRFDSDIALLGYDLDGASFEPGEWLDLTLYWQVLARPADHYTLAIQLVSAAPGETDTLVNFNTWTGGGNYPTGVWHSGDIIADRYRLRLPNEVSRAQGWSLQVVLFDLSDGTRLPFTLGGHPIGDTAVLSTLRVGASDPIVTIPPQADRLDSPFYFDESIALDGVGMIDQGKTLKLTLWWRSVALLADNVIVFVHLYDGEGRMVATADGPPLSGGFATSLWQPGDRVRDERTIALLEGWVTPLHLGIGWYDPISGTRLATTAADGARLPNDEVLIPISP